MFVRSVGVCLNGRANSELWPRTPETEHGDSGRVGEGKPQHLLTPRSAASQPFLKSLFFVGVSALALAVAGKAIAQDAELPPLVVEGNKPKLKKKAAAKKSSASTAAAAQTQAPAASSSDKRAEAVEASDVPYTVPAGVSVIGSSEIDTFGQTRVDNVLRATPGTFTRESSSNPGIAVNIRGFEGQGRVNMMIDGVRQNFRFNGHEAAGFAYVDPQLLAGIEIQRGAVSTVGGAGALAGTANFRTLDVEDVLKPGKTEGALTSLSWGSNGVGWAEMGAAAMRSGGVSIVGALSHHDESDYENGDGQTVPYTGEDLWSGLVKLHFDVAPDERLSFQAMRYNNDFVANSYDQTLTSELYKMSYALSPTDNPLVDLRANVSINNVRMKYASYYDPTAAASDYEQGAGRIIEDHGIGADITNTSRFLLGSVAVTSNYGFEYYYDDVETTNGGVNPTGTSDLASGFTQTKFSYGMFDLIGGLRYQRFTLDGETYLYSMNPWGKPAGYYQIDETESSWDPKVTLAAQVLPWLQPYVTYSESMRPPTASETLMAGVHPYSSSFNLRFLPNPFLVPESQKGWEFGFNVFKDGVINPNDKLRLKADYYMQDVENYMGVCSGPSGFDMSVYAYVATAYFCNTPGTSKLQGVEIEGDYDTGFAFTKVAYTYTHSEIPQQADIGADTYTPDHVLALTGGLRFLDEKLVVGMRGTFVSKAERADGSYTESYALADLFGSYQVYDGLELGVTVENLFDKAYTPALATVPTGYTGIDIGRGRTFLLTTRAQF